MSYRIPIKVTDEQFKLLFDTYPDDPELITWVCQEALHSIYLPLPEGHTQSGIPVYQDIGFNGSGYIMVHWDTAKELDWCLDNGYIPNGFPEKEMPIVWEDNPEYERLEGIKQTLRQWAYPT